MTRSIVVLPGDGIGPEVAAQATRVLETIAGRFGMELGIASREVIGPTVRSAKAPITPVAPATAPIDHGGMPKPVSVKRSATNSNGDSATTSRTTTTPSVASPSSTLRAARRLRRYTYDSSPRRAGNRSTNTFRTSVTPTSR